MSFLSFITAAQRIRSVFGPKKQRFFVLKYLQFYPYSARWLDFVENLHQACTGEAAPIEMIRTKFMRSYYSRKLSARKRLAHLTGHYELEAELFSKAAMAGWMRGRPLHLARILDRHGRGYTFRLERHERYRAEGELTLFMCAEDDGMALAALTFHLGTDAHGERVARIGGLQGPAAEDAKARIIDTTRALYGLRPKAAALHMLSAVASQMGVTAFEAVSDAQHPLRNARHAFVASNDAFWQENAAVRLPDGHFRLPSVREDNRTAMDISAKKRKDWIARQALKIDMTRQAAAALRVCLASPHYGIEKRAA